MILCELFKKYNSCLAKNNIKYEIFNNSSDKLDNRIISLQYNNFDITLIIRDISSDNDKIIENDTKSHMYMCNKLLIYSKYNNIAENQLINLINTKYFNKEEQNSISINNDIDNDEYNYKLYNYIKKYTSNKLEFENTKDNNKLFFKQLINIIPNMNKYCICCGCLLEYPNEKFNSCDKKMCLYKLDEMNVGDIIINTYNSKPIVFEFLLNTCFSALLSKRRNKIFEPFPPKFILSKDNNFIGRGKLSELENIQIYKDFNIIDFLIKNITPNYIINSIKKCSTDNELCNIIGQELYYLLKFMISTNKIDLKHVELFDSINTSLDISNIIQYQIIHSDDIENKFKTHTNNNTNFLFHGSSYENWYSIMRNGIKIMSGTKLMVNAAVYGNGIYLSDSFRYSCEYSLKYNNNYNNNIIVAVFEVKGNKDLYYKSPNIYVINNNDDLLLRYLLVLPCKNYHLYNSIISHKFSTEMIIKKKNNISRISQRAITRISKELKYLLNNNNIADLGIRIVISDDNISIWNVYFSNFDNNSLLSKDMIEYNINEIHFEVRFPDNFPLYPPFFRVISPIFQYQTGRITSGGSICVDVLTKQSWSPATRMESLLLLVKTLLIEGDGRIDRTKLGQEYNIKNAYDSFRRVALSHGWEF
jgi:ubiquitin-protein ligase